MPELITKYFGRLSYEDDSVFRFPVGLPAFEEERCFLRIEPPGSAPLVFLQSMARASLCFLAFPVGMVDPGYRLAMTGEDLVVLGLEPGQTPDAGGGILTLALLSIHDGTPVTANLMAPIVVNLKTRRAVQAIRCDSQYSHAHPCASLSGRPAC
jgi:flagellar assembly factor FliW